MRCYRTGTLYSGDVEVPECDSEFRFLNQTFAFGLKSRGTLMNMNIAMYDK